MKVNLYIALYSGLKELKFGLNYISSFPVEDSNLLLLPTLS